MLKDADTKATTKENHLFVCHLCVAGSRSENLKKPIIHKVSLFRNKKKSFFEDFYLLLRRLLSGTKIYMHHFSASLCMSVYFWAMKCHYCVDWSKYTKENRFARLFICFCAYSWAGKMQTSVQKCAEAVRRRSQNNKRWINFASMGLAAMMDG